MVIIINKNKNNNIRDDRITKTRDNRSPSFDSIGSTIDVTTPSSLSQNKNKNNDVVNYYSSTTIKDDTTKRDDDFCLLSTTSSYNNNNDIETSNNTTQFHCTNSIYNNNAIFLKALSSIVVLNDNNIGYDKVRSVLQTYRGKLVTVGSHILEGLRSAAPNRFAGRVADFNDNLLYEMQDGGQDIHSIITSNNKKKDDNNNNELQLLNEDIDNFDESLRMALLLPDEKEEEETNNVDTTTTITYRGSFMQTERTIFQPAHVDYDWPILREARKTNHLYIAFFPLTQEGAFIQLWKENTEDNCYGTVLYIPYGKMLVVPSDTIHGGGFKRGYGGNLRYHLYISKENEGGLPEHQTNKYTEEHDKRRELCERFLDVPGLDSLLGTFFNT